MNEHRLRELLREVQAPGEVAAERRGLRVASEAFAQRQRPSRPSLPRLALALAIATLLAALVLSPAGAAVRDWIDEVLTAGVPNAEPALTEIPGGGRLLVQSASGPWVVHPDGSRRLLGEYEEATWSPRGLFVGATSARALSAVEPDGTVRWSLSAGAPIADPRWSPSGFRIAYRAGNALRAVAGDGAGDALLDRKISPVPPVWSPQGPHLLAYLDSGSELVVVNADSGEVVGRAEAPTGTGGLDWAADGSQLLLATRHSLLLRDATVGKLAGELDLGLARRIPLPGKATIGSVAFSPRGETIAALLRLPTRDARTPRSEIVLIDPADGSSRRLLSLPGRLSGLAWSPDGNRLLIGWQDADQWLFVPAQSRGRIQAVDGISAEFAPGEQDPAGFPNVEGWCCRAASPASGR